MGEERTFQRPGRVNGGNEKPVRPTAHNKVLYGCQYEQLGSRTEESMVKTEQSMWTGMTKF